MTGVAVSVVDRLGRRPLLLGGVSGIVSHLSMSRIYFYVFKLLQFLELLLMSYLDHVADCISISSGIILHLSR